LIFPRAWFRILDENEKVHWLRVADGRMEERHDKTLVAFRGWGRIITLRPNHLCRACPGAAALNTNLALGNRIPPGSRRRTGCARRCGHRVFTGTGTRWKDHRRSPGTGSNRQLASPARRAAEAWRERHRHGGGGGRPSEADRTIKMKLVVRPGRDLVRAEGHAERAAELNRGRRQCSADGDAPVIRRRGEPRWPNISIQ
jgi:hypothetical protein